MENLCDCGGGLAVDDVAGEIYCLLCGELKQPETDDFRAALAACFAKAEGKA